MEKGKDCVVEIDSSTSRIVWQEGDLPISQNGTRSLGFTRPNISYSSNLTISNDIVSLLGFVSPNNVWPVLNKGFVKLVDKMGNDASIVQAARVSYGEGTKTVRQDQGLINYLMSNSHTTPFEMCEIKLHIKAPIFVARQWFRHRTASINEISARYSILPDEFYIPEVANVGAQNSIINGASNSQGRNDSLPPEAAQDFIHRLDKFSSSAREEYESSLGQGVARELSRLYLPVNQYTEFYWKINLHNLFHFLHLRLDEHAQYEIRVYAQAIAEIVKEWVPMAWEAFVNYKLEAMTLSKQAVQLLQEQTKYLRGVIRNTHYNLMDSEEEFDTSKITKRELASLKKKELLLS